MVSLSEKYTNNALLLKHQEYDFENSFYYPVSEDVVYYDPFNSLAVAELINILGDDYVETNFDLHTLFINLNSNNTEQIYRFVQKYGLLYNPVNIEEELQKDLIHQYSLNQLRYRIGIFSKFYSQEELSLLATVNKRGIYLREFTEEIERLRMAVELYRAIKIQDLSSLSRNTRFMMFYEYSLSHPTLQPVKDLLQNFRIEKQLNSILTRVESLHKLNKPFSKEQVELLINDIDNIFADIIDLKLEESLIEMCIVYLEAIMETGLKGVSPKTSFDIDGSSFHSWTFSSLLAVIYFRIHQDFVAGKRYRPCRNPKCHHLFIAKAKNNNYCSPQCQQRAKTARNRNAKRNKAIKLYSKGLSIEDINKELKVETERIRGWINKHNQKHDGE